MRLRERRTDLQVAENVEVIGGSHLDRLDDLDTLDNL